MLCEDSDIAETFITSDDKIVTVFKGELRAGIWDGNDVKNYFRQVPLCWIENRPVYKGDVPHKSTICLEACLK